MMLWWQGNLAMPRQMREVQICTCIRIPAILVLQHLEPPAFLRPDAHAT